MKGLLRDDILRTFQEEGFVRTGVRFSHASINEILECFAAYPVGTSNFYLHHDFSIVAVADKEAAQTMKNAEKPEYYDKCLMGYSPVIEMVVEECLKQGLAGLLDEIPFLVGYDTYLESSRKTKTFGFHYDSYSWSQFYQTGDDLTIYVPLQSLDSSSGGRLLVEKNAHLGSAHSVRNTTMVEFGNFCRGMTAPDERGLVRRADLEKCKDNLKVAREYQRLQSEREILPAPKMSAMQIVDVKAGEVFLFNNRNYHAVEPWKREEMRQSYVIRLYPLYDIGLVPPATFLGDLACNRLMIDGARGTLQKIDPEKDDLPFHPVQA